MRVVTGILFLLVSLTKCLHAQKRIDQVIPDAEKRKVLKAKKLFNQLKIYEGEAILNQLIKENPTIPYYYEALVSLQRQVLAQIIPAQEELSTFTNPALENDDTDSLDEEPGMKDSLSARKDSLPQEWNGLDPGPRYEDKIKSKKKAEPEEAAELKEAVVTIDSSIIADNYSEEEDQPVTTKTLLSSVEKRKNKSRQKYLKDLSDLAQIPYETYLKSLIDNSRLATLRVEYADSASSYLYSFHVDTANVNNPVNEMAIEAYDAGMEAAGQNKLVDAYRFFEQAITLSPDYYYAHLALGDVSYILGNDSASAVSYKKASLIAPQKILPLERLSKFYYQRGNYENASSACIDAIKIYPKQSLVQLLQRIVAKTGKKMQTQWMQRPVYPLNIKRAFYEFTAKEKTPWWHYQSAEPDIREFTDTNNLIKPNDKTKDKYLETFAWHKMLDSTSKEEFRFARAMDSMGYLDCYTLISCFHDDVYSQFAHLIKTQASKVRDYFFILINWEDKKFEKMRKAFEPAQLVEEKKSKKKKEKKEEKK